MNKVRAKNTGNRAVVLCLLFLTTFNGCREPGVSKSSLPSVSEACIVLENFKGEYSYGGWGEAAQSNDGEVAAWTIYHSTGAAERLVELFPRCGPSGKAYVLAALYSLDKAAFRSLTNTFCSQSGDIHVASGCSGWGETRAELVRKMQRRNSTLAFYPSRPPRRGFSMQFRGDNWDVYEEARKHEQERAAEAARGLEALGCPQLSVFTNLFRVEEATDLSGASIYGVYFSGPEWRANLLPKEQLALEGMVEVVFPRSNEVLQVGITPEELMEALKEVSTAPFLQILNRELGVTGVRLRAAGDRLHWETDEVIKIERALKTGSPLKDWAQIIIDVGSQPREYVEVFHPVGSDVYAVTGGFKVCVDWRTQYRKLTGKLPDTFPHVRFPKGNNEPHYPVVNRDGVVRLVPGGEIM